MSGQEPFPDADEVERLRARVADLEAERAAATAPRSRTGWWRTVVATVLITVGALLAPLAVVAMWAHDEVGDTDRYVENVAPLARDEAVQAEVVDRVTREIFARLDVKAVSSEAVDALERQGLPPRVAANLNALSTPLESAVQGFVTEQVTRLVESEEFAIAWEEANREAHAQLVALLTGETSGPVEIEGRTVYIDLAPVLDRVKQRLADRGFSLVSRIPEREVRLTLIESDELVRAQRGFRALSAAARWLPVLAVLALVGGVAVARDRRRAVIGVGAALTVSMLVLGAALNAARPFYLDAIPPEQLSPDAAGAVYDTLLRFIRFNLRALIVVGLALALGAWVTGPSAGAVTTRRTLSGGIGRLRGGADRVGLSTGPVGAFVHEHRRTFRWGVVGVALLVYVLADHPTGSWTVGLLVLMLLALLVVELLARPPATSTREAATADRAPG